MSGASQEEKKDTRFSADNQPERRGDPVEAGKASGRARQLTSALELILKREIDDGDGGTITQAHKIANAIAEKAEKGDVAAAKECWDRTEGKAPQAIIHQGDEDNPLVYSNLTDIQIEAKISALMAK